MSLYTRGKPFALPLTPDESNRLKAAFEAHCMKKEGRSCRAFLRDMKCEQNPERRALVEQIQQAEASATSPCPGDGLLKDMPLQTR